MEIRFDATGDTREEELLSLYDWLAADRALRGPVRVTRTAAADAGTGRMGPGVELVLAVLNTVGAMGQLQLSYLAWRRSFRPQARVTVDITGADTDRLAELLRGFGQGGGGADGGGADGDDADGEQR